MKILLLSFGDYDFDGRLRELMRVCSQLGELFAFTRGSKKVFNTHEIYEGGYIRFIQKAVAYGKSIGKVDVLILDNRKAVLPGLILDKQIHPRAIVQDCRELYISKEVKHFSGKIGCFFERIGIQRADVLICANEFRAQFMKKYFSLEREPIVYENLRKLCYSSEKVKAEQAKKFAPYLHDGEIRLITTSGCSISRTNDVLVRHLKEIKQSCRLFMVGENTDADESAIRELLHIEQLHNVEIMGKLNQNELKYLISQCDIGIVNYHQMDTNNRYCASGKLFEFLYEGIPVVTTTNPPLKQLCDQYGIGEADDTYADAINKVLENHSTYCANVKAFTEHHTVETNNDMLHKQLKGKLQELLQ